MQTTELRLRNKVLVKAHLETGEPVWVLRFQKSQWRIASIPLSTNRVRYGDIVRLNVTVNGLLEIDRVVERSVYSFGVILEHRSELFPKEFISKVEGLVPWEQIGRGQIAITTTEETWKKVCDLMQAFELRPIRLPRT